MEGLAFQSCIDFSPPPPLHERGGASPRRTTRPTIAPIKGPHPPTPTRSSGEKSHENPPKRRHPRAMQVPCIHEARTTQECHNSNKPRATSPPKITHQRRGTQTPDKNNCKPPHTTRTSNPLSQRKGK